ncbi:T9SS type A sorting domain-containing protein [Neolewinella persica]|uniref:T9SS type A sorting domain-containing protein n=1 Tax=Neolewinella persica TaxID=70998 RepID=UPI0003816722|nr:T9SS type A sorting domain-containing protein [Neolewinella persica]
MRFIVLLQLCLWISFVAHGQDFTTVGPLSVADNLITTADLNGDSFPDVVFLRRSPTLITDQLVRLINNGEETPGFTESVIIASNELRGKPVVADFNQDGFVDIIFAGGAQTLLLFQGSANGELTETASTLLMPSRMATADLNGDEFPDIVGISASEDLFVAYFNTGTGFIRDTLYNSGVEPRGFDVVDIDGDGDNDVLFGTEDDTEESLVLLINDGTGSFTSQIIEDASSTVRLVNAISSGDLNGDGKKDFVIVASNSCFSYLQGDNLTFTRTEQLAATDLLRSVVVGDFNRDGSDDFVIGGNASIGINLYLNDAMVSPSFQATEVGSIRPVFTLFAADMNRDNDLDLVTSNGDVYVLENQIEQVTSVISVGPVLQEVLVFPNPVGEDYIFLTGEVMETANAYELMNISGKLIRKGRLDRSGKISMHDVARGSYLIRLFDGNILTGRGKVIKR